jgi:hypothetical protein
MVSYDLLDEIIFVLVVLDRYNVFTNYFHQMKTSSMSGWFAECGRSPSGRSPNPVGFLFGRFLTE